MHWVSNIAIIIVCVTWQRVHGSCVDSSHQYYARNNRCYYFGSSAMNSAMAVFLGCTQNGGKIAVVTSDVNTFLQANLFTGVNKGTVAWISAVFDFTDNTYKWYTLQYPIVRLPWTNWDPNDQINPSGDSGSINCATATKSYWVLTDCNASYKPLCEYKGSGTDPTTTTTAKTTTTTISETTTTTAEITTTTTPETTTTTAEIATTTTPETATTTAEMTTTTTPDATTTTAEATTTTTPETTTTTTEKSTAMIETASESARVSETTVTSDQSLGAITETDTDTASASTNNQLSQESVSAIESNTTMTMTQASETTATDSSLNSITTDGNATTVCVEYTRIVCSMNQNDNSKGLAVDPKGTSAYRRKFISASDKRPSAQVLGSMGLIVVITVLAVLTSSDLPKVFVFFKKLVRRLVKKWRRRNGEKK